MLASKLEFVDSVSKICWKMCDKNGRHYHFTVGKDHRPSYYGLSQ